jgi:uncharacterized membrane protein
MTSLPPKFLIGVLVIGALLLALSLPLVFRAIPMNRYYGFRTPAAFKSEQNWYEINARGGLMLACGGAASLVVGVVGFFIPEKYSLIYMGAALLVVAAATVVPLVSFLAWQRRFGP